MLRYDMRNRITSHPNMTQLNPKSQIFLNLSRFVGYLSFLKSPFFVSGECEASLPTDFLAFLGGTTSSFWAYMSYCFKYLSGFVRSTRVDGKGSRDKGYAMKTTMILVGYIDVYLFRGSKLPCLILKAESQLIGKSW